MSYFAGVTLLHGYLASDVIVEEVKEVPSCSRRKVNIPTTKKVTKKVVNWVARDEEDVFNDFSIVVKNLVSSLKNLFEKCSNKLMEKLCSLDFHTWILLLGRSQTNRGAPFNEVEFYHVGLETFKEVILCLSEMPFIIKSDLSLNAALSANYLTLLKEAISSCVWGDFFHPIGASMFEITDGDLKGKTLHSVAPQDTIPDGFGLQIRIYL